MNLLEAIPSSWVERESLGGFTQDELDGTYYRFVNFDDCDLTYADHE